MSCGCQSKAVKYLLPLLYNYGIIYIRSYLYFNVEVLIEYFFSCIGFMDFSCHNLEYLFHVTML